MRVCLLTCALGLGLLSMAAPADAAGVQLIVRHQVADYATWRKAYNGFAATQKKLGVTAQSVYQSIDDPRDITVLHTFATLDEAKAFTASDELKSAMQSAGVTGMPQVWITREAPDASGKPGKVRMFVHHQVARYLDWRKVYLEFQPTARKLGLQSQAVYWSVANANDVVVLHDFASADKAKAFVASSETRSAMQSAGVMGMPQIWFTRRLLK